MVSDEREWQIEELIHRRTDLSTFVIHWTRDFDSNAARGNLISILKDGKIAARTPMGAAVRKLEEQPEGGDREGALASQRVVCFTEAPLEQAWSFVCSIYGRQVQLRPYGLAFTKRRARRLGINPVWYVDATKGRTWELMGGVWSLVDQAIQRGLHAFPEDPIARIAPFVEIMGKWDRGPGDRKEFWWEREWRHRGDLEFKLQEIAVILCPKDDMRALKGLAGPSPPEEGRRVPLVDPRWGLEHIIAALAGVPEEDRRSV
jgi:hypothetical protein